MPSGEKGGRPQNLVSLKDMTAEKQREITSAGGKASVAARRRKKLLSQIYADMLAADYDVKVIDEKTGLPVTRKLTAEEYFSMVSRTILERGDAASGSHMREIREATEGNALTVNNVDLTGGMTRAQKKKRIAELTKRLDEINAQR